MQLEVHQSDILPYLLYLPDNYDATTRYPLILFLHGIGERGHDPLMVKKHGLPVEIEQGRELPCLVIAPQCPPGQYWTHQFRRLMDLLNQIEDTYSIDESREYLTGLSMGGYGAWHFGSHQPERFAALVPICGGGEPSLACRLRDLPIWAFHGAEDEIVPLYESQVMVEAVRNCGGNVQFTVYPDVKHDSWSLAYRDPALYRWMFEQQRQL